jgi:hypothetical protein
MALSEKAPKLVALAALDFPEMGRYGGAESVVETSS